MVRSRIPPSRGLADCPSTSDDPHTIHARAVAAPEGPDAVNVRRGVLLSVAPAPLEDGGDLVDDWEHAPAEAVRIGEGGSQGAGTRRAHAGG